MSSGDKTHERKVGGANLEPLFFMRFLFHVFSVNARVGAVRVLLLCTLGLVVILTGGCGTPEVEPRPFRVTPLVPAGIPRSTNSVGGGTSVPRQLPVENDSNAQHARKDAEAALQSQPMPMPLPLPMQQQQQQQQQQSQAEVELVHPVEAETAPGPASAGVHATVTNIVPAATLVSPQVAELLKGGAEWLPVNSWAKLRGFEKVTTLSEGGRTRFVYQHPAHSMSLEAGRLQVVWDGVEIWLGYKPKMVGSILAVHRTDVAKTLELLFADLAWDPHNNIIVLDPGHGGARPGTRSVVGLHFEKELTLDWANRLKPLLEAQGWKVLLTRTNDTDVTLPERAAFAEGVHASIFLSLHFNATAGAGGQAGFETYCLPPEGMPSNVSRGYPDDIKTTFPNNAYDAENFRLALKLHQMLARRLGASDRGLRRARFMGILRPHSRPAALLEGGYLSNPAEARLIETPAYRQKLAQAVAEAFKPGPEGFQW